MRRERSPLRDSKKEEEREHQAPASRSREEERTSTHTHVMLPPLLLPLAGTVPAMEVTTPGQIAHVSSPPLMDHCKLFRRHRHSSRVVNS